jgi:glutamate dehydrogenase
MLYASPFRLLTIRIPPRAISRKRRCARGGIRIVKSRNGEAYNINARSLFDENYNLANTSELMIRNMP